MFGQNYKAAKQLIKDLKKSNEELVKERGENEQKIREKDELIKTLEENIKVKDERLKTQEQLLKVNADNITKLENAAKQSMARQSLLITENANYKESIHHITKSLGNHVTQVQKVTGTYIVTEPIKTDKTSKIISK